MSILVCTFSQDTYAEEKYKHKFSIPRHYKPTTTETGIIGLNTVPSARMDKKGTIRIGAGTSDPYLHSFIGFQLSDPLYVSLRQSAQISSLKDSPESLHPGIDFKIRLMDETATRPAIAIGFDSAFGDKRMASEYVTLSKRFKSFDITGGIGWGRLGSVGHIKNPLANIAKHFDKPREYNTLTNTYYYGTQNVDEFFTGEDIGFFGGIEYFTPLKNVSIKADYGANDFIGEQIIAGFNPPSPWAISLNYSPIEQADLSLGVIGGKKIMARLSLQDQLYDWIGSSFQKKDSPPLLFPRPDHEGPNDTALLLNSYAPTGLQIGQISRGLANNTSPDKENLTLALRHKGLKGPVVTLMRSDLENAILRNQGSIEEIWQDAMIETDHSPNFSPKGLLAIKNFKPLNVDLKFILDQKIDVSEASSGLIYRTSGLVELEKQFPLNLLIGVSGRVDISNNLHKLNTALIRPFLDPNKTIRNDEDLFAGQRFGLDRFYTTWLKTLAPDTHIALSVGHLEEMYAGYGGEILYRPFDKKLAIGAEGWSAYKRDPYSSLNRKFYKDHNFTGHLNLFYEMPNDTTTLALKVGQYLGKDVGGTLSIKNKFKNGSYLEGFITSTNLENRDILGNKTHLYGGVRFNLPLGNIPFIQNGSEIRVSAGPIGRDNGQILDNPQPLYEVTEPISSRQLTQSWTHLLD